MTTTTYTVQFILDYAVISTNPVLGGIDHKEEEVIAFATTELFKYYGINLDEIGYQEVRVLDADGDDIYWGEEESKLDRKIHDEIDSDCCNEEVEA